MQKTFSGQKTAKPIILFIGLYDKNFALALKKADGLCITIAQQNASGTSGCCVFPNGSINIISCNDYAGSWFIFHLKEQAGCAISHWIAFPITARIWRAVITRCGRCLQARATFKIHN